jgi:N-acetylglutamate synthase-like GNAT family acetyltransferase
VQIRIQVMVTINAQRIGRGEEILRYLKSNLGEQGYNKMFNLTNQLFKAMRQT